MHTQHANILAWEKQCQNVGKLKDALNKHFKFQGSYNTDGMWVMDQHITLSWICQICVQYTRANTYTYTHMPQCHYSATLKVDIKV